MDGLLSCHCVPSENIIQKVKQNDSDKVVIQTYFGIYRFIVKL